ncbi:MAG TPA: hydrogenase nickel incorporation protein HypB [Acidimicrobiales bacterium]|nr:hydrogenase nickel incorporation protein HypB [Acidimicrobiales bacterium]
MGRFHRHPDGSEHAHEHPSHGVGDHSGYDSGPLRVEILEQILGENDSVAQANADIFNRSGVCVINLMSSPGAGKTMLLERTLRELDGTTRIGIIEGDIETSLDADRLTGLGAQVSLVNTGNGFGGECHLDATMVRSSLRALDLGALDIVIIENVGNLVCPAEFLVGEHARAMVYAVTEGEEKPLKYPVMFRAVDVVVVNKIDLLEHLDFDLGLFLANLDLVNHGVRTILVSARTGEGIDEWCSWLLSRTGVS